MRFVLPRFNPKSKIENLKCYLITRSALANTFGGIVRSICLAAFKLITNSDFAWLLGRFALSRFWLQHSGALTLPPLV
jgi:hypothetical protein